MQKIVSVDEERCVNCHQCISVCPVKYCNNGEGQVIKLDESLCIGCGECLIACTHNARLIVDDFSIAMNELQSGSKVIAIISPSTVANFPNEYLKLNGWLKSLGVDAFFDVSFGAELTVKSYIEHLKNNQPKLILAQPCPALVSYIELYKPSLLKYLAPADSPMMHVMKMVREFYPQYANHKMLVVSPCVAKKREFIDVGIGDFNVTIYNIKKHFEDNNINLSDYPEVDYDNDPAERAVLFSSPGGLLATAEREIPEIKFISRKIEGPNKIYHYFDHLEELIEKSMTPILVDCLNCELGCNGGTGTGSQNKSPDELEFYVNQRSQKMKEVHRTNNGNSDSLNTLRTLIDKFWKEGLYDRVYTDRSEMLKYGLPEPDEKQTDSIFKSMKKYTDTDIKNCSSCGYDSCKGMAKAIFNNLNKIENCHHYINQKILEYSEHLEDLVEERTMKLRQTLEHLQNTQAQLIESEKMAILGQLIAGVAHEVNTPLGAIRSSIENVESIVRKILGNFDDFYIQISDEYFDTFNKLLERAYNQDKVLSMKEERKAKRELTNILAELNVENSYDFAEIFVEIGIYNDIADFVSLLRTKEGIKYFNLGYSLLSLHKSSQNIIIAVNKAAKVVYALKRFAHFDISGEPIETDLVENIETVLTLYYNQMKHGIEITRDFDSIGKIEVFPDDLNQVWTNLIQNSIHAMEQKGIMNLSLKKQNNSVIIKFTDSGKGIPQDIVNRIFDPFFTTKPQGEGSGLGLDIVKKIIDKHKGNINVESEPGRTCFTITLPANLKQILKEENNE
jgi:signal transduction histidine kinase/iron only hydrogenase large subunit-like protein